MGWVDFPLLQPGSHNSLIRQMSVEGPLCGGWGDAAVKERDLSTASQSYLMTNGGGHSNVLGVCTKEGGPIGSPLTLLPPHSNLSRTTQVQVKEREDPVNPD